jgi:hypothetical protein
MRELELTPTHSYLETPISEAHFGPADKAEPSEKQETGQFVIRLAEQPVAAPLDRVFASMGKAIPPEVDIYQRFKIWLVPHRLSILRRRGSAEITAIGLECEYTKASEIIGVIGLIPSAQFVTHGSIGGNFTCSGAFTFGGEPKPVTEKQPGTENSLTPDIPVVETGSLKFGLAADAHVAASFNVTVATPYISAVGIGGRHVEWLFNRHNEPLFGRDIETWSVLLLPKRQRQLEYKARYYATVRTFFFPTRYESDWATVACDLQ